MAKCAMPAVAGSGVVVGQVDKLAKDLFTALDTPFSLGMLTAIHSRDYMSVVSAEVNPLGYTDADKFSRDYLAAEVFSKFPSWDTGVDLQAEAIKRFRESEDQCLLTNRRFKGPYPASISEVGIGSVLHTARLKIWNLLGEFRWEDAEPLFDLGPGATYSVPRSRRHAYYKFSGIPESTRECAGAAEALVKSIRGWWFHLAGLTGAHTQNDSLISIVPGNRITTVPKNAKTDRLIAIEPLLNGILQKGIGGVIRNRLRRVSIDLNDQQPNQLLALEGSRFGNFATIDLKGASDSVSYGLVVELLPPSWVSAMDLCRSRAGILPDGTIHQYHKWSSMGNGYTFELESLIFWAICSSVVDLMRGREHRFLVYGDDLVVPTANAGKVIEVLGYCGFSTNTKKTFVTGPFRESCGKHYFNGTDVSPFYFRDEVNIESLILYANNVRRYSFNGVFGLNSRLKAVYEGAVSMLPRKLHRPRLPDGFGDAALIGDFDEAVPSKARHGLEGWVTTLRLPIPDSVVADGYPMLLATLLKKEKKHLRKLSSYGLRGRKEEMSKLLLSFRIGRSPSNPGSIPGAMRYKNCKVLIPWWDSKGPWV